MAMRRGLPCVTSPHPEGQKLIALRPNKQLRVCLLSKRAEILRHKPNIWAWCVFDQEHPNFGNPGGSYSPNYTG